MKHLKKFGNNISENLNKSDNELNVKVKHLIKYLENEFDPEADVRLDRDGWLINSIDADNEIELIKKRGIFNKLDGNLFIYN